MRHSVAGYTLGRKTGARIALRRNLIKQFFTHERIQTTKAKAAFEKIKKTVLVEDISLEIEALNGLPGTFIKFFLAALGSV